MTQDKTAWPTETFQTNEGATYKYATLVEKYSDLSERYAQRCNELVRQGTHVAVVAGERDELQRKLAFMRIVMNAILTVARDHERFPDADNPRRWIEVEASDALAKTQDAQR